MAGFSRTLARPAVALLAATSITGLCAQTFTTQGVTGYVDHDPERATVRPCAEIGALERKPSNRHVVWKLTNTLGAPVKVMEWKEKGAPKERASIAPQRTIAFTLELGGVYVLNDANDQCLAAFQAATENPQILTLREGELGKRMKLRIAIKYTGSPGSDGELQLKRAEGRLQWFQDEVIVRVDGQFGIRHTVTLMDHGRDEVNGVDYWRLRSERDSSEWAIADYGEEKNGYNAELVTTSEDAFATNFLGIIEKSWETYWPEPAAGAKEPVKEEPLGPPPSIPKLLAAGTDMAEVTRFVQGFRTRKVTVTTGWCPGTSMGREPATRKLDRLDSLQQLGGDHCWMHVEFNSSKLEYGVEGLREAYITRFLEPMPELPFGLRWDMDKKEARRMLKDRFVAEAGLTDKYEVDGWTLYLYHEGKGGRLFNIRIKR